MYEKSIVAKVFVTFVFFFTASLCEVAMADKFDWLASESAPRDYPMQIVFASFYDPDGGSIYIPTGKTIGLEWGGNISTHIVGSDLKPLPKSLKIAFFSYTENQFYRGDFELPYNEIVKYFEEPYYSYKINKVTDFRKIVVGVAPGGVVSVWVNSVDKTIEVFSGQADKIDLDWKAITNNQDYTREEYIQHVVLEDELSSESLASLKKNGVPVGLWQNYRKRYNWQLLFSGQKPPVMIDYIRYFNGERDLLKFPLDESYINQNHPIPKAINFVWDWPVGSEKLFELTFNENEIMESFQELEKDKLPIYMEFLMSDGEKRRLFSILLKNEKHQFYLKKTDLQTYDAQ